MTEDDLRQAVREELANHVPPRLLSVKAAAKALGLAERAVWELIGAERLRSLKVGRRRLIPVAALDECVAQLEGESAA